ncbi:homoaconitase [Metarhizium acridum CQMa 102]|uniref:Homoaconitase, mitochondrial n=1 Tax=Metarhizium acridum (strain CQMa 102) TaxID=655827 RepID=E9ECF8_METAQ|nr:homoaconitase [Metarhizium acridum CQMa 102]EFY86411.1 homoaconitase [Metarhizium acridum CQMa 102]
MPLQAIAARSLGRASGRPSSRCLYIQHVVPLPCHQHSPRRSLATTTTARARVSLNKVNRGPSLSDRPYESKTPQTLTEKIVQRHAVGLPKGKLVRSGDYVQIRPHRSMNATRIEDPTQPVFAIDHQVQLKSEANLRKYELIEAFAKKHGVAFFPAGYSIGHQVMIEELFVWPGTLCVGSDSHSCMYGALGSLGVAVVRTDGASIWATGKSWFQVPPVAQVTLTGTLPPGVTGKDVILALCSVFPTDVLNHGVEFVGSEETMSSLSVDDRLTISNMATEWSATSAMFPVDGTLERWLRKKASEAAIYEDRTTRERITHDMIDQLYSDPTNLSSLSPQITGPNSVKISTPLSEVAPKEIKIDKAYIVSCTNSRSSDLKAAAKVFQDAAKAKGSRETPKIADHVELYIAAASTNEQKIAEEQGSWQTLLDAGAIALPAACGPCIGLGRGLLKDGEVGISASNRNFKGRMGSRLAQAYLASPEVVAASALSGKISGPGVYKPHENLNGIEFGYGVGSPVSPLSGLESITEQLDSLIDGVEPSAPQGDDAAKETTRMLPGFPNSISGEIVFCDADNLDTDNIYAAKWTYQDDVTKEGMAEVCMSNYDPDFGSVAKPNDILVSGYNFGCGSSREQAATAILARQIPLVVAGSLSSIFARNSINNALLGLEVPRLVERLRAAFPSSEKVPTRRTGWTLTWDISRSTIKVQEGKDGECWEEKVGQFPENLQEIIAKGGLTEWVKHEIAKVAV